MPSSMRTNKLQLRAQLLLMNTQEQRMPSSTLLYVYVKYCKINCVQRAMEFIERNKQTHADYLALIAEGESRDSTTYGINCASPLQKLTGFDITKCLPLILM